MKWGWDMSIVAIIGFSLGVTAGSLAGKYVLAKKMCASFCDTEYFWYDGGRCICADEKKAKE